jgi:hypothetical protein
MEPEKPIEKLLRAAAEKRRAEAGAPLPLHPANRRILQSEATKTYGARPARKNFFAMLWPQLGWSFAIITGLAVAASMMLPRERQSEMTLAQNRSLAATKTPASASMVDELRAARGGLEPNVPAAPPTKSFAKGEKSTLRDDVNDFKDADLAKQAAPALAPAPGPLVATDQQKEGEVFRRRYGLDRSAGVPQNRPAVPEVAPSGAVTSRMEKGIALNSAAPASEGVTLKSTEQARPGALMPSDALKDRTPALITQNELKAKAEVATSAPLAVGAAIVSNSLLAQKSSNALSQTFVSARFAAGQADNRSVPAQSTPLLTFEWRQDANQIQILDQDGSLYLGTIEPTKEAERRLTEGAAGGDKPQADRALFDAEKVGGYTFQVNGTNATLGQRIIFKGQLSVPATPDRPVASAFRYQTNSPDRTRSAAIRRVTTLTNAEIKGDLTIGNNSPVPVRAKAQMVPK